VYTNRKVMLDDQIGGCEHAETNWFNFINDACRTGTDPRTFELVYPHMIQAFNLFPPKASEGIKRLMFMLTHHHISWNISSNTNFISGEVISEQLRSRIGDAQSPKFQLYSDLIGIAKPSPKFFECVIERSGVQPHEILHVGDDMRCDIEGASSCGLNTLLIVRGDSVHDKVLDYINHHNK
jgi:phosphoglycolate phosphatase-like HAD superfamily hydrolase